MKLNGELLEAVRGKTAVVVAGTGVSAGTTDGSSATWLGLLQHGASYLQTIGAVSEGWAKAVEVMLDFGRESSQTTFLVQAATQIGDAFIAAGKPLYGRWLAETVGALSVDQPALAAALVKLPIPIFTTNYDTLLEQVGQRESAHWQDTAAMQRVLSAASSSIGHLHGVWSVPDSVVLTSGQYEDLLRSPGAQAVQQALAVSRSLIYVGVGAGLGDPNFERFLSWQRRTLPTSGIPHFRLCRDSELPDLTLLHANDNIRVVSYGPTHSDLAPYLLNLGGAIADLPVAASGLLQDPLEPVRTTFREDLKAELILGQPDSETKDLRAISLEPVLLPVPHEEYVSARKEAEAGAGLSRLNPLEEAALGGVIILAGEQNSGLTFTAKWMVAQRVEAHRDEAPVYISFTQDRKGGKRLPYRVRQALRGDGLTISGAAPLPPLALIVDDFSPNVAEWSGKTLLDVKRLKPNLVVITCAMGTEEDIRKAFDAAGQPTRVRYVGKLERADINTLAELADAETSERLVELVEGILLAEHLPRTPFTVSQLLFIVMRNAPIETDASQTSVMDEFVGVLLGRGDPQESPAFATDFEQRVALLEYLAEEFVERDKAGLTEADAVLVLEMTLARLGWPESAIDLINEFKSRGILVRRSGFIVFSRSSYLHLFIAKRAQKDTNFRDRLLKRPEYYFVAIAHYAALARHDGELLRKISEWLDGLIFSAQQRGAFEELEAVAASNEILTMLELSEAQEDDAEPDVDDDFRADLLASTTDEDPPAFPVALETGVSNIRQLLRTLNLSSRVLRDADQAGDAQLKQSLLRALLLDWGRVIDELVEDPEFRAFFVTLSNAVLEDADLKESERASLGRLLERGIPAAIVFGTIDSTLASRKLSIAMNNLVDEVSNAVAGSPAPQDELLVAGVFFLGSVGDPGWPEKAQELLRGRERVWVVREFIRPIFWFRYMSGVDTGSLGEQLLRLCAALEVAQSDYPSDLARRNHEGELIARLRRLREKGKRALQDGDDGA